MKLHVKSGSGELTVPSQKEFLLLWQRGFVSADDLVRRDGKEAWVRAADLPWIRGMTDGEKKDKQQLVWLTIAMAVVGLCLLLWLQAHTRPKPPRSKLPFAVKAVPSSGPTR